MVGVVGLDTLKRLGVMDRLKTLPESCRKKRWKVPSTSGDVVALADELVLQVEESGIQIEDDAPLGTVSVVEKGVVWQTANSEKE